MNDDRSVVDDFVQQTLGELALADPELRECVRVWTRSSATRRRRRRSCSPTATVVRRLAGAGTAAVELSRNAIAVAAALEHQHWQGSRPPTVYRFPPNAGAERLLRAVPRIEVVHLIGDRGWGEVGVGEGVPVPRRVITAAQLVAQVAERAVEGLVRLAVEVLEDLSRPAVVPG